MKLHHVQLSMQPGSEQLAREFYAGALEFTEVPKPEALRGRGGCWFRAFDEGAISAELHLGVDPEFEPPAKAHPALLVAGREELEAMGERMRALGCPVDFSERTSFEGYERFHTRDPFGNRLEFLAPLPADRVEGEL
ncbi:VOC family protein [Glutamicibacter soli]